MSRINVVATYRCIAIYYNYRRRGKILWAKCSGFQPIEVFMEIFLHCPDQKCLLFSIIIERHLHSWENFCGTLENRENCECLAQ